MSERPTRTCRTCGKAIPANRVDCRLCAARRPPSRSRWDPGWGAPTTWLASARRPRGFLALAVALVLAYLAFRLLGGWQIEASVRAWAGALVLLALLGGVLLIILVGLGGLLYALWERRRHR